MAGSMSLADLVADLKGSLQDAASTFDAAADGDFKRHLQTAALALGPYRPRNLMAALTLVAGVDIYPAAADCHRYLWHTWGASSRLQPWESAHPGPLPRVVQIEHDGVSLMFDRAPTAAQLTAYGATFPYLYRAQHVLHGSDGAQTTVQPGDRGLLLQRAQAEACRELALRGLKKPVQLRDGHTGTTRNSTPSALYEQMLAEFDAAARS